MTWCFWSTFISGGKWATCTVPMCLVQGLGSEVSWITAGTRENLSRPWVQSPPLDAAGSELRGCVLSPLDPFFPSPSCHTGVHQLPLETAPLGPSLVHSCASHSLLDILYALSELGLCIHAHACLGRKHVCIGAQLWTTQCSDQFTGAQIHSWFPHCLRKETSSW
jgi:hypothetical protein